MMLRKTENTVVRSHRCFRLGASAGSQMTLTAVLFAVALSLTLMSCFVGKPPARNTFVQETKPLEVVPGVSQGQEFYSVIVLPDTQYYSKTYPQIFLQQTKWIVDSKERLNIVFVSHSGDIVNDSNDGSQWDFADIALRELDGTIPYAVLPGNHDQPTDTFNESFGTGRYEEYSWYGGHYGSDNDNNYQFVDTAGGELLFMNLEFAPSAEVVSWAKSVLDTWPDRRAILNTHSVIDANGTLTSEGDSLRQLFREAENLDLVLCGHVHGEGSTTLTFGTHKTHILLADFQKLEMGGNGYLRILTFIPERDICVINTYSPWLQTYIEDDDSHFEIEFPDP